MSDAVSRTPLGQKLRKIRERIKASGRPLLDCDAIDRELGQTIRLKSFAASIKDGESVECPVCGILNTISVRCACHLLTTPQPQSIEDDGPWEIESVEEPAIDVPCRQSEIVKVNFKQGGHRPPRINVDED